MLTFQLYGQSLTQQGMTLSFFNSLAITIPATILPILFAAFAAYAIAWMSFRGKSVLLFIIVGLIVVPLQLTFVPILKIYNSLGLTGTFLGIWLAHTGYGLPFAVFLLFNFFSQLPRELFEAAEVDGATAVQIFFRLILPLSVPVLASLAIFQFLWVWNDLLVALIYLGGTPNVAPMTVTIANQVNSLGGNWQVLTASAFVSMILPLLIFFTLQRYFVRGILAGSVKG
jgi:alpha-glucoside transport system permease protein